MDGTPKSSAGVSPASGLPVSQQAGRLRYDTAALLALEAMLFWRGVLGLWSRRAA